MMNIEWRITDIEVSKEAGAVEQESDRAVVDAGDLHVFAEDAFFDGDVLLSHEGDDFFVKLLGDGWFSGGVEAGTAAFAAVAVQRELADQQNGAVNILNT